MVTKKIAVLMSTYNGEKYLKCQIDSILNQKLKDTELNLVIRDDGSTDNTVEIIKEYIKNDTRVYLHHGFNLGYVGSFISLLDMMKTEYEKYDYYALSDQDDRWDEDKLQIGINYIKQENTQEPVLYQSYSRIVDKDLNFICYPRRPRKRICFFNTMIQTIAAGHTYIFNRALLDVTRTDIDCSRLFGHDSYIVNVAAIFGRIVFDSDCHADYRQHANNQLGTSSNNVIFWIKNRLSRVLKGDSKLYGKQIEYIYNLYKDSMSEQEKSEAKSFLLNQKSFMTRIKYINRTEFYRQWVFDNIAFRLLYLMGGYNT